jgi:uncharacterized protein (DUF1800 family)
LAVAAAAVAVVGGASVTTVNLLGGANSLTTATTTVTSQDAARFLTQASFGPTDGSIGDVQTSGIDGWISQQESMPLSESSQTFMTNRLAARRLINKSIQLQADDYYDSFWKEAVTAPDQLRQRVKFALSEIFVVSFSAPNMNVLGLGSYYDMLGKNAFGNYRTLLEAVARHPMMGMYLNMLANAKEDPTTGELPDENFAREIQQLFSIGLYQLNQDGTYKTDANGNPIPTYTVNDIQGLAKVFTGFSWYSTTTTGQGSAVAFYGKKILANAYYTPMVAYPAFHSTSQKTFLGVTIPASTTPDPNGDLKIALDTIFNHPNVGPFVGKQLIQRLVTSNPSPAYVSRVAGVFNDNGAGVRGDLGAVVRAVLTDPEARDATVVSSPTFGKLREPVVRIANWARAFNATSHSGWWLISDTSDPVLLDQAALNSPTVFNFFRPGYSPPGTSVGALGLVAPEMQIANEISAAGYLNTLYGAVSKGIGIKDPTTKILDVISTYSQETAIAGDAGKLADRLSLLALYGQMSPGLRDRIVNAVNAITIPGGSATQAQINVALNNRAKLAVFMTFASPEYLAQR